jgi:Carboxypeptidase regulatory-like domain
MSTRVMGKDELQRLRIASPCQASWGAMQGDRSRRHCQQCDKHVYDFAELTPREISGLIAASGGEVCARLTRGRDGQLVTLRPPAPPLVLIAPRRVSPLAAAVVTAVLGLGGAAWAAPAPAQAAETGQGTAGEPGAAGARHTPRTAGGTLRGRLVTDAGEPIPDAEVRVASQIDNQETTVRTDADGRFAVALAPGLYGLSANARDHFLAGVWDLVVAAGTQEQVTVTVASETWQAILAGEVEQATMGVLAVSEIPLRKTFAGSPLVVLAVAGKSVPLGHGDWMDVRTDLVISTVLKGETRERVISVYHDQDDDDPANRLRPGDRVLAFLEPREEGGRNAEGYDTVSPGVGLRRLSAAESAAYGERLEALARMTRDGRDGAARPADLLEWLVATTEDPVTRKEAAGELSGAYWQMLEQAGKRSIPADRYAADLRDVFAQFLATGRQATTEDGALVAAFLTDAHRERLTAALLRTTRVTQADLELYTLVGTWGDDRRQPWLIGRLEQGELESGLTGLVLATLVDEIDGEAGNEAAERFKALLEKGNERIGEIESELQDAQDAQDSNNEAERQRLAARLTAAEDELRRGFLRLLGRRGGR